MSDAEARRKRIDEENISTADLAGARSSSADDRQAKPGRPEDIIDVEPKKHEVRPVDVQKTEVSARTVPIQNVDETGAAATTARDSSGQSSHPSTHVANQSEDTDRGPLFQSAEVTNLRAKWEAIQVGFVDEPRRSVQEADSLVAATMKRLAEQFAAERSNLESQWDRGSDISTEDLRIALRRYRSFFGRLLSI
jgi:hypothetical protein